MQRIYADRGRLQWGMLLFALLVLGGAVFHNQYKMHIDVEQAERQRLLGQVRMININLSGQLRSTNQVLNSLSKELQGVSHTDWKRQVPAQRLQQLAAAMDGVRSLLVLDLHGTVLASNWTELQGKNFSSREYFINAAASGNSQRLFLSAPFKTALQVWGINLVRIIPDQQGRFAGIVAATLDPAYFATLLQSVNYAPDMWSALSHSSGVQFLMVPDRPGQSGINLARPGSFFSRHLATGRQENVLKGTDYATNEQRLMALCTINPPELQLEGQLVVAASRDLQLLFRDWQRHFLQQTVTFAGICLVAVMAMVAFQRYRQRQLVEAAAAEQALLDARQQLTDIIDFLPDATFVIDNEKRVVIWNRAMERLSGVPKEEMLGQGDHAYTIPFYGERRPQLLDLFDLDDEELRSSYANIRRTGEILDAESFCPALHGGKGAFVWATGVPLYDAAGQRIGAIESIRDISEKKRNDEFLRKLTHGIEHSASAVMITDLHGTIEYVNRKFTQLTGFQPEEAIGKNPRILKSDATPREVFDNLWRTILAGEEWRGELLNRRKSGEVYWSVASISPLKDAGGVITHFIANVEDINERKNAEATIERLAYYDPLTELPNRRMLRDRLDLAFKRSRRQGLAVALLYLDLDSFKHINDSLGHPAGDKLLREVAGRLTRLLRDDDTVCRLGGDEFAVILHDIRHEQDVALVTQKLLDEVIEPVRLEEREVVVSASIGVALFPRDGDDASTLEKHADIALYHAKAEGKNTFRFFQEELNSRTRDRITIEQGLRHALERGELFLLYQPKVDLATGEVSGVEALVRWSSPELGMVSPLRFIPLAEETRQIIPIGEWVLRTACRQQLDWQQAGLQLSMAVNLSAVQFKMPGLVERIDAIISVTGVAAENLELELTESALVDKPDEVVRILEQLRRLGCNISIDDFGTGYSSLSYLKTFPVTVLKIDRTFVRDLAHDSGDRAIARSIVHLARNLSMKTVAEGAETAEQLEILRQIGCSYVQGFYYARPLPAEQIPATVRQIREAASGISGGTHQA